MRFTLKDDSMEQKVKPKKRFSVAYRRCTHDKRQYNTNPYIPHFLEIIARAIRPDKETLKRVNKSHGRFFYQPSDRYLAYRRLLEMRKHKLVAANEKRSHTN